MPTENKKLFRWVHFSDLHVGSGHNRTLWPRFKTLLFADLERSIKEVGALDLVLFSGDLVNRGTKEEFKTLDERLREVLEVLGQYQPIPKLIVAPGNHDLIRPLANTPEVVALRQYWNDDGVREEVWNSSSPYARMIKRTFKEFSAWQNSGIKSGSHVSPVKAGYLPGDAAYRVKAGDAEVGVVVLNSTWLQLGAENYQGELDVDVKQLLELTGDDPDSWLADNDANILVTHHPHQWLRNKALGGWSNDIAPSGRFDLHAFGHMHEPQGSTRAIGGGYFQNTIQAASLFGLETYGDAKVERIQGYSICR